MVVVVIFQKYFFIALFHDLAYSKVKFDLYLILSQTYIFSKKSLRIQGGDCGKKWINFTGPNCKKTLY